MPESYSFEVREQAAELYVTGGLTYEQVSKETGVPVQTLKRWASEENWTEQKREFRKALSDIRRKTVLLQRQLIQKALETLDPQAVYAVARLIQATRGKLPEGPDAAAKEAKDAKGGLDEETLKRIREEVYGL
jgi:transposase-like protein